MSKSAPDTSQKRDAITQQGWEDISELEQRMEKIVEEMSQMASSVAAARQINEFASDRRKTALADAIEIVLSNKPEMGVAACEHAARALPVFKARMKELVAESLKAENAIATWQVLQAKFDCCRSILSTRKELARL